MTLNVNRRQSFKFKLCLWIFALATLAFTAVFMACVHFLKIEVKNDLDALVNAKLDYALRALDEGLTTTVVSSENLVSISKSPFVKNRRDSIYSLCRHFLDANPRIQGVAVGYEPGVVKGHEKGFAPYIMRTKEGYINRDLSQTKDYRNANWYKVAHDTGKPCWSKPFIESNGTIITSYNVPLKDNSGKVYAVIAVDLNLNVMADSLQQLRPYPTAMLTVVDKDGTFVAHPNRNYILNESLQSLISKADYAPNERILNDIKAGKRGSDNYETKEDKIFIFYAPVKKNGWTITLEVPRKEIAKGYDKMFQAMLLDMIIGVVLLVVVCVIIINRMTRPLELFADAAKSISHGDFDVNLPMIKDRNELYDLRQAFVSMKGSLQTYITQLADTTKSKAIIEGELNTARKIQMAMIPKIFPPYPDRKELDIYGSLTPAKAVGGDLYDFVLDGDDFYFVIGDVSGKGVPASLFMAITRSLFRNNVTHAKSPAAVATLLNNALAQDNEENMFVTMFIGCCNLKTGVFTCCNCGHNAPATNGKIVSTNPVTIAPGQDVHFMTSAPTNIPIGVMENYPFEEISMQLEPGIKIMLYTDGITEAENAKAELYGEERFLKTLSTIPIEASVKEAVTTLIDDVHRHAGNAEQSDDITVLCMGYI